MADRIDHKLLDQFLGYVLDAYKAQTKTRNDAIADIAHLVAAIDLPKGQGDDPTKYMKAIMAGDDD